MWDLILAFIAKLLSWRDDNTIPPIPKPEDGAPDPIENDKSTPLIEVPESRKPTQPPFVPRPPTILPPGIKPPLIQEIFPDHDIDLDSDHVSKAPQTVEPVSAGITTVGAWAGSRSLANPQRYVDFAVEHSINRLDIVVNDHSKWREPHDFTIRNVDRIVRLAGIARQAGIEIHLMSWIMPHVKYIEQAAETLIPLAAATHAASIQWDAEEPWMLARNHDGYVRGGEMVGDAFKSLAIPMGVNGIGYASVKKLRPLAKVCDYIVPQVYSTSTTGLDPRTAPAKFHKRWRQYFGKPVVMGLAAYRQKGIPGYTQAQAMQSAIIAVRAIPKVNTVIYWSLYHITKNRTVAKAIADIRGR